MSIFKKLFGIQDLNSMSDEDMLAYIKELQEGDETPIPEDEEESQMAAVPPRSQIAMLGLFLCSDGTLQIASDWNEKTPGMADIYGKFLSFVISDKVKDMVFSQLMIYANHNVVNKSFVEKIMEAYEKYRHEENGTPVINPSEALKLSTMIKEELSE